MGTKYVSGFATTFAWNNPTDNGRTVASNFAPRLPLDARRTMSSRMFLRQLIRPQLECQSIDWFSKNNVLLSGSNVYPVNVKKEVEQVLWKTSANSCISHNFTSSCGRVNQILLIDRGHHSRQNEFYLSSYSALQIAVIFCFFSKPRLKIYF